MDMSYLRESVDTNRVSIEAILQLINDSQSDAVINEQQPMNDNNPDNDVRFSRELERFKRAFADEKAIARETQANLMFGISQLSEATSKHLDGIADVVMKLDNRLNVITEEASKLDKMLTDEISKLDSKLTDSVSTFDKKLNKIVQSISDLEQYVKENYEKLYGNISSLVKDSSSNTADLVKVNVADIVGHLEQNVLVNMKASCNYNSKRLTSMYIGLLNEVLTTSPCVAISTNNELHSLRLCKFSNTIRLANASCTSDGGGVQGRVEVNHKGEWGTVCDDNFAAYKGATVVCRSLGFSSGVEKREAYFGQGSGPIWLDEVQCKGTENDIFLCPGVDIGSHNCGHGEDVGVICR